MDYLTPVSSQGDLPVRPLHRAHNGELAALWRIYGGEPFHLLRTREGRDLSRARYQRAKEFQRSLEPGAPGEWTDFLYCTGIVVQLALSCHLLDVGFALTLARERGKDMASDYAQKAPVQSPEPAIAPSRTIRSPG